MNPISKQILLEIIERSDVDYHVKNWFNDHLIEPKEILLKLTSESKEDKKLLLITEHTGDNDSSYRVVYSPENKMFGLEMTSIENIPYFLGFYGTLEETLRSM